MCLDCGSVSAVTEGGSQSPLHTPVFRDSVTRPWAVSGWWRQQGPRLGVQGFSAAVGTAGTEGMLGHRP